MSKQGKIRLFQWIQDMGDAERVLFFAYLARELTVTYRAFRDQRGLTPSQIIDGCSAINELQHRILMRLLPKPKLNGEQTDFIISEITRHAETDKSLSSHLSSALNSARRRTRDEIKEGGKDLS